MKGMSPDEVYEIFQAMEVEKDERKKILLEKRELVEKASKIKNKFKTKDESRKYFANNCIELLDFFEIEKTEQTKIFGRAYNISKEVKKSE